MMGLEGKTTNWQLSCLLYYFFQPGKIPMSEHINMQPETLGMASNISKNSHGTWALTSLDSESLTLTAFGFGMSSKISEILE